MNVIRLTSLMNLVLLFSCLNFIVSIQELLTVFQIHYHLLLLIMFITLIWTWLRVKFTLSVKIGLGSNLGKVWYLTCMVACQATCLMLDWNLLLFLWMLTMGSICHSTMDIASYALLISICLIRWLLLNIIGILLISILRLHNIIIIYMFILIQSLFLSSVMRIVDLISNLWIISTVVHLIRALNHIHILVITWNVMRLKMILLLKNVNVFISGHYVCVWHRIVKVLLVVTNVLLSWLKNVLNLCF